MLQPEFVSLGEHPHAQFRTDAPLLTEAGLQQQAQTWWGGRPTHSEPLAVGIVAPSINEAHALDRELWGVNYTLVRPGTDLHRATAPGRAALRCVVAYDLARDGCDLPPVEPVIRTYAGFFGEDNPLRIGWHSDDATHRYARYTLAHGTAPTQGAVGEASRQDVVPAGAERGSVKPGVPIGPGKRLQPTSHPLGTVLRFFVDIHAPGEGIGPRILHQATLYRP